jgi:FkbM family methyltransferase
VATIAHRLSKLLPAPVAQRMKPAWHRLRDTAQFVLDGGRISWDSDLKCRIASRQYDGRRMDVAVRSYRELRRYLQFNANPQDAVAHWMGWIKNCEVLYDVGSANGLEGFYVQHLHGAKIVFIEPYAPSIETILKTIARQTKRGVPSSQFEVVHAGCDNQTGYHRYLFHGWPNAGETGNTFSEGEVYARDSRRGRPVTLSQWVAGVSLDSLHWQYGLPLATHVKVDVDGYEGRVMAGAAKLLESGHVRSWALELSGEHVEAIRPLMARHGYAEVAVYDHYPGYEHYTGDHIFVRADLKHTWFERFPNGFPAT